VGLVEEVEEVAADIAGYACSLGGLEWGIDNGEGDGQEDFHFET
jgi:hypothetical protein